MIAAQGILTSRGGKTSHAAVVARGMGKTCVCGAEELDVDTKAGRFTAPGGVVVSEGDVISIDGTSGDVYLGEVPVVASPVVQYFEGGLDPADADELVEAVDRIMRHADARRRLGVRANADTGEDCARARRFGAGGVGLVRTEHMFLGERRQLVERLILADDDAGRQAALDALLPLQRGDFVEILEAMDGLPVTIRLIDPPLHEFLPDLTELSVRWRWQATRPPSTTASCSTRCAGCTSRTRCSGCAVSGSAWSSPACSPCRSGRSRDAAAERRGGRGPAPGDHDPAAARCRNSRSPRRPRRCSPRWRRRPAPTCPR